MKKIAAVAFLAVLTATGMSGCSKFAEPFKDAPRSGVTNDEPADTITFPDGFSNIATKCDHGNRLYSAYHGDGSYATITVVPNAEDCP